MDPACLPPALAVAMPGSHRVRAPARCHAIGPGDPCRQVHERPHARDPMRPPVSRDPGRDALQGAAAPSRDVPPRRPNLEDHRVAARGADGDARPRA